MSSYDGRTPWRRFVAPFQAGLEVSDGSPAVKNPLRLLLALYRTIELRIRLTRGEPDELRFCHRGVLRSLFGDGPTGTSQGTSTVRWARLYSHTAAQASRLGRPRGEHNGKPRRRRCKSPRKWEGAAPKPLP